jgi:Fic family protein
MNYEKITLKKQQLDRMRPLPSELVGNLDDWFRIELTFTSNAIEGNTLTRQETALVVEKGLTVGGKTLVEHLEATNHASALDWVKAQVSRNASTITEHDILRIHEIILKGIDDAHAGHYRSVPVRISGSHVVLPNPVKVPDLMEGFTAWLTGASDLHPVEFAAEAHYRLVTIHPFVDGNGRTGRLLMNLLLMIHGYPPAIIRKRDRLRYIRSLEKAQLGGSQEDYHRLISAAVDRSLDIYLKAVQGKDAEPAADDSKLLKIGELAKRSLLPNSTIRHWTKEGLLDIAETTESGYQLYEVEMLTRVKRIQELQGQRFTLQEIREKLQQS